MSFGLLDAEQVEPTLQAIETTTDTAQAAAHSAMVIEAVSEKLELKQSVFKALDAAAPPETILASNTSSFLPDVLCLFQASQAAYIGTIGQVLFISGTGTLNKQDIFRNSVIRRPGNFTGSGD